MHFYWELKKSFFIGFHGSGWGNTRPPPGTLRELKSLVHHLSADSLLPLSNMFEVSKRQEVSEMTFWGLEIWGYG